MGCKESNQTSISIGYQHLIYGLIYASLILAETQDSGEWISTIGCWSLTNLLSLLILAQNFKRENIPLAQIPWEILSIIEILIGISDVTIILAKAFCLITLVFFTEEIWVA